MAGFDGDVHIEVARTICTAVESEGCYRPFGEFRKRLAAAGIRVSSTIASRLWRAVDDSAEISADEEEEEEEVKDGAPEPQSAQRLRSRIFILLRKRRLWKASRSACRRAWLQF